MKSNVDLTLNRDFQNPYSVVVRGELIREMFDYIPETYQYEFEGVKKEHFNYKNPDTKKDVDDFEKGITIVNTGSRDVRSHKLNIRELYRDEVCYECGQPIRIKWKGCPCYRKYLESHGGIKESCRTQLKRPTIIK